jgi:hypothetical protein
MTEDITNQPSGVNQPSDVAQPADDIAAEIELILRKQLITSSSEDIQLAEQIIAALPTMSLENKQTMLAELKQSIQ